jgi:hypothetical protein
VGLDDKTAFKSSRTRHKNKLQKVAETGFVDLVVRSSKKLRPYLSKSYALDFHGFSKQLNPLNVFESDDDAASSAASSESSAARSESSAARSDSEDEDVNASSSDSEDEDVDAAASSGSDNEDDIAALMAARTFSRDGPPAQQGRGRRRAIFSEDSLESAAQSELDAFLTRIRSVDLSGKVKQLYNRPIDDLFKDPYVRNTFSLVTFVTLSVLAVSASSAFIERLFSRCGLLLGKNRHNLKMLKLIQMLFMQYAEVVSETHKSIV